MGSISAEKDFMFSLIYLRLKAQPPSSQAVFKKAPLHQVCPLQIASHYMGVLGVSWGCLRSASGLSLSRVVFGFSWVCHKAMSERGGVLEVCPRFVRDI